MKVRNVNARYGKTGGPRPGPPTYAESGLDAPRSVYQILHDLSPDDLAGVPAACSVCGRYGGTLTADARGGYVHADCLKKAGSKLKLGNS